MSTIIVPTDFLLLFLLLLLLLLSFLFYRIHTRMINACFNANLLTEMQRKCRSSVSLVFHVYPLNRFRTK